VVAYVAVFDEEKLFVRMNQDQTPIDISMTDVVQKSYVLLWQNIKPYIALSVVFALPFVILSLTGLTEPFVQFMQDFQKGQQPTFHMSMFFVMILNPFITMIATVLLFRLFLLGQKDFLKISVPGLIRMLSETFKQGALLLGLSIIAMLCLAFIIGLFISIFAKLAGLGQEAFGPLSGIIAIAIMISLLILILRTTMTFASIAEERKTLPLKSSFYYSRNHGSTLTISVFAALMPVILIQMLVTSLIIAPLLQAGLPTVLTTIIFSPLNVAPLAIVIAVISQFYHQLVPFEPLDHSSGRMTGQNTDISV